MEILENLAAFAKDLTTIAALLALIVKPIRERLFGDRAIREGQKCLLRSEIVRTYYRHQAERTLRQYEFENLCKCFAAYKALGGNSFVQHIFDEMQEWKVIA